MSHPSRWIAPVPLNVAERFSQRDNRLLDLLRDCALFEFVADAELDVLVRGAVRRSFRRGDLIQRQGDRSGHLHLITSGSLKLTLEAESGEELLLTVSGPGETFGEIAAIDGGEVAQTATALEPTETLAIRHADVITLFLENPDFAASFVRRLASQLRIAADLLESTTLYHLDVRMARRLLDLAQQHGRVTVDGILVELPLTQSELAAMLGATRVRVNLLLGRYQDEGLIRLGRGSITLLAPDELRRRGRR